MLKHKSENFTYVILMFYGNFVSMYTKKLEVMEHRLHSLYLKGKLYYHALFQYYSPYMYMSYAYVFSPDEALE
jgi:hypothetical protein